MLEELVAAAIGAVRSRARPTLTGLWLHLAAALLCLLGGLYFSFAIFLAIEERLGPPLAGALTGAFFLVMAGILLLWAISLNRKPPPRENDSSDLVEALLRAGDLLGRKIEAPNAAMAITALLGGLVVGISPAARGFLLNLIDQIFKENTGEPK